MQNNNNKPPQFSVILRILGGGYLVYLAYDLLTGAQKPDTIVTVAAIVFGIVGTALVYTSGKSLITNEYFYNKPSADEEELEEEQDEDPKEE